MYYNIGENKNQGDKDTNLTTKELLTVSDCFNDASEMKAKHSEVKHMLIAKVPEASQKAINECSNYMLFAKGSDVAVSDKVHFKVLEANRCKNRFCHICSSIKAYKDSLEVATFIDYLSDDYEMHFLTLTVPNVKAKKLKYTIDKLNKNFSKLFNNKYVKVSERDEKAIKKQFKTVVADGRYNPPDEHRKAVKELKRGTRRVNVLGHKDIVKGSVRKLEITYNEKSDTYHPHLHVLVFTNKQDNVKFERSDILINWQLLNHNANITQVDIREYDGNSVMEIAGYSVKNAELYSSNDVFNVLYDALKGRQLITYAGCVEYARKLLKEVNKCENIGNDHLKMVVSMVNVVLMSGKNPSVVYNEKITAIWNQAQSVYDVDTQEVECLNAREYRKANDFLISLKDEENDEIISIEFIDVEQYVQELQEMLLKVSELKQRKKIQNVIGLSSAIITDDVEIDKKFDEIGW